MRILGKGREGLDELLASKDFENYLHKSVYEYGKISNHFHKRMYQGAQIYVSRYFPMYSLTGGAAPYGWLYRCVKWGIMSTAREIAIEEKERRENPTVSLDKEGFDKGGSEKRSLHEVIASEQIGGSSVEMEEMKKHLAEAFGGLKKNEKILAEEYFINKKKCREIAKEQGYTSSYLETRMHYIRKKILKGFNERHYES